jgi:translation initiation factor 2B subunit (eIF-2B alpha/beta/delta family)
VLARAAILARRVRGAYQAAARFIRTIKDPKTRETLEKRQEALEKAIKRVDEAVKRAEAKVSAKKIARGHGFENHIVRQSKRYPDIKNQEEYRQLIEKIIREEKDTKNLKKGRTAYWDEKSGFFVVENPNDPDGGTAFRPSSGKAYFDKQD